VDQRVTRPARITPYRDGPLLVRGPFTITDQDGKDIEVRHDTVALCRCGRSRRKPFCDGMHKAIGFRAQSASDVPADQAPQQDASHPAAGRTPS
jgi:CDGSH-type Zn-finger protein